YYPISILGSFQQQLPGHQIFGVLYNIGCHLVSVSHAYVHKWASQIVYDPQYNSYWGLSDGEGPE
ncbi:hypothetical protein CROQUDRAFT_49040, partial [Cronartium quercuum f. sp. fusiforme G11]